jgi:Methyltransferase FkbM domain
VCFEGLLGSAKGSSAGPNGVSDGLERPRRLARRLIEPRFGAARRIPFGPAKGLRFEADPVLSLDYWLGLYESELARWVRRMCRGETRCVDVGAYNGYHALVFAKLTKRPVLTYEPDPQAVIRTRRNVALNPQLAPLIELREVAVGGAPGPGIVSLDAELLPRVQDQRSAAWLLKIDVDGPESEVLRGAREFLRLARPHLIVETHAAELEHACAAALMQAGYSPVVVTQRRRLPADRSWPPGAPVQNRWLVALGEPSP